MSPKMRNSSIYPFPGMNPWLEHPSLWGDVHFRLISALARFLSPLLTPNYYVGVGTHTYISTASKTDAVRYPDVLVVETPPAGIVRLPSPSASSLIAEPLMVEVPVEEMIDEAYLEVREPVSGDVITVIEVLSPLNKRPGAGRAKYLEKRLEIFSTLTHLVEIDLLRAWPSMPFTGSDKTYDYRILLRRGEEGTKARLYGFNIQDMIPRFPLPLQSGDDEPIIDLNNLLKEVYFEGSFYFRIDYNRGPVPKLEDEDAEWAAQILQQNTN